MLQKIVLLPSLSELPFQKKQNLHSLPQKKIIIPVFSHYELDIHQQYGLKALQNYRIINKKKGQALKRLSEGIRLFLYQVIANEALPFEIKAPNKVTREAMIAARNRKLNERDFPAKF